MRDILTDPWRIIKAFNPHFSPAFCGGSELAQVLMEIPVGGCQFSMVDDDSLFQVRGELEILKVRLPVSRRKIADNFPENAAEIF
jgi:hypothetical protein